MSQVGFSAEKYIEEQSRYCLLYTSGISLREISEAIGMSYSNMKIIHRKALAGLKKHLDI